MAGLRCCDAQREGQDGSGRQDGNGGVATLRLGGGLGKQKFGRRGESHSILLLFFVSQPSFPPPLLPFFVSFSSPGFWGCGAAGGDALLISPLFLAGAWPREMGKGGRGEAVGD